MTVNIPTGAPTAQFQSWNSIKWDPIEKHVKRLQMRIAKATREGRYGKVKSLQWLLTHSYYAKLLAIKRVTSNSGAKTPGVDGIVWNTSTHKKEAINLLKRKGYQPQPLRRVHILKKDGKSKRPLGIPVMQCRGLQALYLLALEPVAETLSDQHSYGFRPKRSCADAIEQCFNIFSRKTSAKYVLEGDIKSCFDMISHKWLLEHAPMDKIILEKWLKCGYMDKGTIYPTLLGFPQGGIASPTLLNLTLKGLDAKIASVTKTRDKVNLVVYADDFIVSGNSKDVLEDKVKPAIEEFLKERGLELSEKKTVITSIDKGFDFLGFNIRKYKDKLLIKPSKKNVNTFLRNIRDIIKSYPTCKTENLIYMLNPKIRGWVNYFRHVVSKDTFQYVDCQIFLMIWQWACRRHPNRSKEWIYNKYFLNPMLRPRGILRAKVSGTKGKKVVTLIRATTTLIRRHIKIKANANPFDPAFKSYFKRRDMKVNIKDDALPIF